MSFSGQNAIETARAATGLLSVPGMSKTRQQPNFIRRRNEVCLVVTEAVLDSREPYAARG